MAMNFGGLVIASQVLNPELFASYTLLLLFIDYLAIVSEYMFVRPMQLALCNNSFAAKKSGRAYVFTCLIIYLFVFSSIYFLSISISSRLSIGLDVSLTQITINPIFLFVLMLSRSYGPILRRASQALGMQSLAFNCDLLMLNATIVLLIIFNRMNILASINSLVLCFFMPYTIGLSVYLFSIRTPLPRPHMLLNLLKKHSSYVIPLGIRAGIQICTCIVLPLIVVKMTSTESYAIIRLAQTICSPTALFIQLFEPTLVFRFLELYKFNKKRSVLKITLYTLKLDILFPLIASFLIIIMLRSGIMERIFPALNSNSHSTIVIILIGSQLIGFIAAYLRTAADTFQMSMHASSGYFIASGFTIISYILLLKNYSAEGYVFSLLLGQFVGLIILIQLNKSYPPDLVRYE